MMWKLKACPRCGGDIFPDWEQHVWFEHCLQCGYSRVLPGIVEVREKVSKDNLKQAESKKQTAEKEKKPVRL